MNELRLILLGIGLLIIAGIYFWEVFKTKRHIRSRVEKLKSEDYKHNARIEITPKEDLDDNDLKSLSNLKDFNFQTTESDSEVEIISEIDEDQVQEDLVTGDKPAKDTGVEKLIVLYIMAEENKLFKGKDIIKAMESVGMKFGAMNIFHYFGSGESKSKYALFSLLNITEPGYFDLDKIETFTTRGLALFMRINESIDGEKIFDTMLDTAWKLVELLDGELHDENHNFLDPAIVVSIREKIRDR